MLFNLFTITFLLLNTAYASPPSSPTRQGGGGGGGGLGLPYSNFGSWAAPKEQPGRAPRTRLPPSSGNGQNIGQFGLPYSNFGGGSASNQPPAQAPGNVKKNSGFLTPGGNGGRINKRSRRAR